MMKKFMARTTAIAMAAVEIPHRRAMGNRRTAMSL